MSSYNLISPFTNAGGQITTGTLTASALVLKNGDIIAAPTNGSYTTGIGLFSVVTTGIAPNVGATIYAQTYYSTNGTPIVNFGHYSGAYGLATSNTQVGLVANSAGWLSIGSSAVGTVTGSVYISSVLSANYNVQTKTAAYTTAPSDSLSTFSISGATATVVISLAQSSITSPIGFTVSFSTATTGKTLCINTASGDKIYGGSLGFTSGSCLALYNNWSAATIQCIAAGYWQVLSYIGGATGL